MFIRTQCDLDQIEEYLSKPAPLLENVETCTYHERPCGLVLPPGFFQTLYLLREDLEPPPGPSYAPDYAHSPSSPHSS
jgi:hypothetical protein